MVENYESAACRHFLDAVLLKESERLDNAGHLIAFAAECAIKHRISSLRPNTNSPHGHFPEILIAARKHLGQRSGYTSMYGVIKGDIFNGWNVNRRYEATGVTSVTELTNWFAATKRLFATAGLKARK